MEDGSTSLNQIAARCLDDAGGDWQAAALAMRVEIDADPELREDLLGPLISGAIWDRIRHAGHKLRIKCQTPNAGSDSAEGIRLMAQETRRRLLDFPLRGGKRLGDATRPEVADAADWYETLRKANGKNAKWLHAVAKKLPDDEKVVSDVLSEKQAHALLARAEKAFT